MLRQLVDVSVGHIPQGAYDMKLLLLLWGGGSLLLQLAWGAKQIAQSDTAGVVYPMCDESAAAAAPQPRRGTADASQPPGVTQDFPASVTAEDKEFAGLVSRPVQMREGERRYKKFKITSSFHAS
jgi:hypothetical protein